MATPRDTAPFANVSFVNGVPSTGYTGVPMPIFKNPPPNSSSLTVSSPDLMNWESNYRHAGGQEGFSPSDIVPSPTTSAYGHSDISDGSPITAYLATKETPSPSGSTPPERIAHQRGVFMFVQPAGESREKLYRLASVAQLNFDSRHAWENFVRISGSKTELEKHTSRFIEIVNEYKTLPELQRKILHSIDVNSALASASSLRPDEYDIVTYLSPLTFCKRWRPFGIYSNDTNPSHYKHGFYNAVVVIGRGMEIYPYWANLRGEEELYFYLTRNFDKAKNEYTYFKLVPTTSRIECHGLYEDSFGMKLQNVPFYVGSCQRGVNLPFESKITPRYTPRYYSAIPGLLGELPTLEACTQALRNCESLCELTVGETLSIFPGEWLRTVTW